MTYKSPFFVVEEFLSPLACEDIVSHINFTVPDMDTNDRPIKTHTTNDLAQSIIFNSLEPLIPRIEQYYNFEYKGTETMSFEWYAQDVEGTFACENSAFVRGKWLRVRPRDVSAILFLSDYNDRMPFEDEYEVYGGKLEFPQHQFGFLPRRGTLIAYPSDPHFINMTAAVLAGDLYQARMHIAAQAPLIYQPSDFPGDFTKWFADNM